MLPTPKNYAVYPSVMLADTPTEVTIVPLEKAFLFFENEEYRLTLIAVDADELEYAAPQSHQQLTAVAHDGALRFTHTFSGEQEHLILLEHGENQLQEFTVYSLYEDLYRLRPLRGDFHSHSYRSDGKRDPAALAGHYREQGYDFFALTDHNRYYPGGEIDETYANVKTGITRIPGEEVHTPGSVVHIVHTGDACAVTELYLYDRAGYEQAVAAYKEKVPAHVPSQYKTRYAMAMWATDKIHEAGGLAIFAHPFWRPKGSHVHNVQEKFARLLLKSGMFDAYELIGGMGQPGNNRSIALWSELKSEGLDIAVVGSSDVHTLERSSTFPGLSTICFAEENESNAIVSAIKAKNSVAVETTGDEYARHYRCYGSYRLVAYAQFLLHHYFPNLQRICQGEGVAMRAYAMGDAPKALIELQVEQSENYALRFFGKKAPALPDAAVLDFEERWRARHLQGPTTKGSHIDSDKISRQI